MLKHLVVFAAGWLVLAATPTLAADPKVDAAVKTFSGIGADPAKLKTYCELTAVMASSESGGDAAKSSETDKKIEDLMASLGPDFQAATDLEQDLQPDTPDGKTFGDAVDGLDAKCAK